ncbi:MULTISPECIES: histidine kinase [unclassified Tenacibaculum]|uniref:tetratricopeptide repeat-containing sensor histidine kinase n=1 Tax=unclassified Tenacibaculum TaxID=2635139 RepID=UPI001F163F9F|nr:MULTISPECIES: histidine kinase [unclassified Tenacibaculum]MCF2873532.1 histidine kinase [Tenacibaculum sp. Cn5-1]MCF2933688.1 histidine kinase [Tenacibaculum sp. Cn5-34]MCG7509730.1 histidine kinase [Tenacibaculum sp. Cn5-46]
MNKKISILFILLLLNFCVVFSQNKENVAKEFSVKVKVVDNNSGEAIKNADVSVNGKRFLFSNSQDRYIVKAKSKDELVVTHPDFMTVYYTIKDSEDIKVLVKDFEGKKKSKYSFSKVSFNSRGRSRKKDLDLYSQYFDSVKFYKQKNLDKSLTFVERMLNESETKRRKSVSYKELGEIYTYWKQYDLAIENYKASINEVYDNKVLLLLAKTELLALKNGDAKRNYKKVLKGKLSKYDRLLAYEGLGDAYKNLLELEKALDSYKSALNIAQERQIKSKITDLNARLAEVYVKLGEEKKADSLFESSLDLAYANLAFPMNSLKVQQKVADYYNQTQRYDDEIDLRKESLKNAENIVIDKENKELQVDSITSQKINYKIGNAYILKEEYNEAIPYLKKSIEEANKNEDIVIQKDATRKLSEVLESVGNHKGALEAYQSYVKLVDTLYSRKEQEIQQIKRFGRRIAESQNRISSLEKDKELAENKIDLAYKDQQITQESNKRQEVIIYSLLAGILLMCLLAYFMHRTNKEQKLANNLLALKSMRSQMNPHFIFNALNSVNNFIAVNDERSANRYLSEFSVLMRSVLENSDEDFIPLTKEIELLELYVKLEHNRFKDKFEYLISVDEKIKLDTYTIPPMLLQPYIENAIWHGLRYKKEKGNLTISMVQYDEESILITIKDDGVGRKKSKEMKTKHQLKQKSKGMSTIQNRIAILNDMYKDKIAVSISDLLEDETGTKVEMILKRN